MVAQRLVEALRARDADGAWRVSLFAEEPRTPYDRVALTSYFSARDAEELALGDPPCGTTRWSRCTATAR